MIRLLFSLAILALTGCASFQSGLNAAEGVAVTSIKSAEDGNIKGWTLNACGTPFSAAIRHPEIIPALRALCLPGGGESNPALLLDGVRK